jgi:hypothetical protein
MKITELNANICLFSPVQYLTGSDNKNFRGYLLENYEFTNGFMIDASNFADVKSWGLSFSILSIK